MPDLLDHLIMLLLAIVLPVYGATSMREADREELRRSSAARVRAFRRVILLQWGLTLLTLGLWLAHDRSLDALGLGAVTLDRRWWIGLGLSAVAGGYLVLQPRLAVRDERSRQQLRVLLERIGPFMPRSTRELMLFAGVCVTAGICEEILCRGWMFWYLASYLGGTAAAWTGVVVIAAVVFALAHAYQGARGIVQVFVIGLAMGGLYLLTRTLWLPMLLHFTIDFSGGLLSTRVLREDGPRPDRDPGMNPG